ncbi:glutathionylspermidine synthase family protein [Opitutus sp. ER46]|uniref:glutathionylspermidine synthase family protein n=1 Tax=Opitutus sp. ER46 TaxID=2161864 RepID=UPI000D30F086|nr:glutathionylspermidine synthase family protein [Opitutus sp. ER46]PTX95490.1 glutathionylspermidine synthase family protein [Opitutus sp. ER46]
MKRISIPERPDWRAKVETLGFTYHTHDTGPYWDETAYYAFSAREVDALEAAANALHQLCIDAAQVVIDRGWWSRLGIPTAAVPAILASWERDDPSLYGRFDLAYDGVNAPKLLEYNADTPTSLIEASVVQWYWLQERFPAEDQFNSIHEHLIEAWRNVAAQRVHFAAVQDLPEDTQTVTYLMDTCQQAGFQTQAIAMDDIGWDEARGLFVDVDADEINALFKLYPWEWMWHEPFARYLGDAKNLFIEPPWKLLLSNKGLLPVLWELYPDHPNLLPAYEMQDARLAGSYAKKPRFSREGANVTLVHQGKLVESTGGEYGEEGFVYQALAPIPDFAGHHPVCGVWVVNHEACGLGLREDTRWITGNVSRFVPHLMTK